MSTCRPATALATRLRRPRELARTARHRAVGVADVLTSVLAAEHRLTLVHYDTNFDLVGDVLDFDRRWIAARGTL